MIHDTNVSITTTTSNDLNLVPHGEYDTPNTYAAERHPYPATEEDTDSDDADSSTAQAVVPSSLTEPN